MKLKMRPASIAYITLNIHGFKDNINFKLELDRPKTFRQILQWIVNIDVDSYHNPAIKSKITANIKFLAQSILDINFIHQEKGLDAILCRGSYFNSYLGDATIRGNGS